MDTQTYGYASGRLDLGLVGVRVQIGGTTDDNQTGTSRTDDNDMGLICQTEPPHDPTCTPVHASDFSQSVAAT